MLAQDEGGETRFAIDATVDESRTRAASPSARLIDAFARQLGAAIGRDAHLPYRLWVCVPPEAEDESAPRQQHAEQQAGA
jgi:hypothetical protein